MNTFGSPSHAWKAVYEGGLHHDWLERQRTGRRMKLKTNAWSRGEDGSHVCAVTPTTCVPLLWWSLLRVCIHSELQTGCFPLWPFGFWSLLGYGLVTTSGVELCPYPLWCSLLKFIILYSSNWRRVHPQFCWWIRSDAFSMGYSFKTRL